ncbi:MAG: CoA pyrophosphatase [Chloroflexi bacterium]|nr:MAG: CoA pyrophosphatase [Chloroflexota bacterium]MBL1196018.1 CoA pyrophosphatase [Chloroflexota bacterium]NOH13312.1 CoA pyrophosphatase [Chloroflexota bacterium]
MTTAHLSSADIAQRLANQNSNSRQVPFGERIFRTVFSLSNRQPRAASVLIPLLRQEEAWHILLIRRTEVEGDMHSGQVAFPGGATEKGDSSVVDTALRETEEEIGLQPDAVEVLGQMPTNHTISNFMLTPVVGTISWPFEIKLSENEVSRVFTIPLDWLMDEKHRRQENRRFAGLLPFDVIYFDKYDNELLWGVSAYIMVEFLNLLRDK